MADLRPRVPNIAALCRDLGDADYSWVHECLSGKATPSKRLAKQIEAATQGSIRWTEFFRDDQEAA